MTPNKLLCFLSLAPTMPVAGCCACSCLQVKATHVTEIDYNRAAAGEWIVPAPLPAVGAAMGGLPGMNIPGLAGGLMPGFAGGMMPGGFPYMAGGIPGLNPLLGFPPPP
jgi:hypothetical protein